MAPVHSTYSDGEFTLSDLKEVYVEQGFSVVCITDHDDHFHPSKLAQIIWAIENGARFVEAALPVGIAFQILCSTVDRSATNPILPALLRESGALSSESPAGS